MSDTSDAALKILHENYENPGHVLAFAAPSTIYKYFNGELSMGKIKDYLSSSDVYTQHREVRKPKYQNPTFVRQLRELIQLDLATFDDMKRHNEGYAWMLVGIDCLSRKLFVELIKNKKSDTVLNAFKLMHEKMGQGDPPPPAIKKIVSDSGKELNNRIFKKYCKDNNINYYLPSRSAHATTVERAIRSLKGLIGKYMTSSGSLTFHHVLPQIVETYNTRPHRMVGDFSPRDIEADPRKLEIVKEINEEKWSKIPPKKPQFQEQQLVRINKYEGSFHRAYQKHFSQELFKVYRVLTHMPIPLYMLVSLDDKEVIRGNFAGNELVAVKITKSLHIDKIHKTEADRIQVSFKTLPASYKVWIMKNQLYE